MRCFRRGTLKGIPRVLPFTAPRSVVLTPIGFFNQSSFSTKFSPLCFNQFNYPSNFFNYRTFTTEVNNNDYKCKELFDTIEELEETFKFNRALRVVNEIIELNPSWNPIVYIKKAELEIGLKQDENLVGTYLEMLDHFPKEQICYQKAISRLKELKRPKDILQILCRMEENFPHDIKIKESIALTHYKLKQYNEAIDYFIILQKSQPKKFHFEKGLCFMHLGQHKFAVECFDEAINHIDASESPEKIHFIYFNSAKAYLSTSQIDKALPYLIKAYEHKALPHVAMIICYISSKLQRYEDAIKWADICIAAKSDAMRPFQVKGYSLAKLGRFDESHALADHVMEKFPNHYYGYHFKGLLYQIQKRYKDSLSYFSIADNYYQLHQTTKREKEKEEKEMELAVPNFFSISSPNEESDENVKKRKPVERIVDDIRYNWVCMAVSYRHLNDYKAAVELFNKGFEVIPPNVMQDAIHSYLQLEHYAPALKLASRLLSYNRLFTDAISMSDSQARLDRYLVDLIAQLESKQS